MTLRFAKFSLHEISLSYGNLLSVWGCHLELIRHYETEIALLSWLVHSGHFYWSAGSQVGPCRILQLHPELPAQQTNSCKTDSPAKHRPPLIKCQHYFYSPCLICFSPSLFSIEPQNSSLISIFPKGVCILNFVNPEGNCIPQRISYNFIMDVLFSTHVLRWVGKVLYLIRNLSLLSS